MARSTAMFSSVAQQHLWNLWDGADLAEFKATPEIRQKEFALDLYYFSQFAEAIVLHDEVAIFSPSRFTVDGEERHPGYGAYASRHELFARLLELGLVRFLEMPDEIYLRRQIEVYEQFADVRDIKDPLRYSGTHYALQFLVALENGFTFQGSNYAVERHAIAAIGQVEERFISEITRAYESVFAPLRSDVLRLLSRRRESTVYLPPIAAVIMERAVRKRGRLADEMAILRDELEPLRNKFREFEQSIRDDGLQLGDSLDALSTLERGVRAIVGPGKGNGMSIREWKDFADLTKVVDGLQIEDAGSLTKMALGAPAALLARKFQARGLSSFGQLRSEFLTIRRYGEIASDTFGIRLPPHATRQIAQHAEVDRSRSA